MLRIASFGYSLLISFIQLYPLSNVILTSEQRKEECQDEVSGTLTTCFVYDWSIKEHPNGSKMWMRRSRFVAREFATDRRLDTYSPASGCRSTNLIPILYLKMLADSLDSVESLGSDKGNPYQVVLAALDIKDAFLQVPQEKLVIVSRNPFTISSMSSDATFLASVLEQRHGMGFSGDTSVKL